MDQLYILNWQGGFSFQSEAQLVAGIPMHIFKGEMAHDGRTQRGIELHPLDAVAVVNPHGRIAFLRPHVPHLDMLGHAAPEGIGFQPDAADQYAGNP